jgi:predicted amidohydrolase
MTDSTSATSRRAVMAGAVGLAAGAASAQASEQVAQAAPVSNTVKVSKRGVYETVPLRQDGINVCAIQSRVRGVDIKNLKQSMAEGLKHATKLINHAQGIVDEWGGERIWGAKQDLICMHEFPIQGFRPWNRAELNKIAFELPGPEVDVIAQLAKKHDCYIAFGCYAKKKDWPDHVINMSVIVGPKGDIVSEQWKARNILGLFGEGALIGTTIYDVLDRYVEMYGWDATLPIARTDIGNIAMTAVGGEPMLYQALALKGAEVMILSVTGGNNPDSAIAAARASRVYTVGVGNSVSFDNPGFSEAAGSKDEGTVVVDPRGVPLARSANHHEDYVSARVGIADFRKTRRFPELPMALFMPVFQQYEPKFGPNTFLSKLPKDYKEAGEIVRAKMAGK